MTVKKILNIETFGCKLQLVITNVIKKEIAKIYKSYGVTSGYDGEVEGMLITGTNGVYHLIIDDECLTHNTIAHEIYHAVVRITEDRDVVDEETQAWLCGYISEVLYNFIKLKKLEIK